MKYLKYKKNKTIKHTIRKSKKSINKTKKLKGGFNIKSLLVSLAAATTSAFQMSSRRYTSNPITHTTVEKLLQENNVDTKDIPQPFLDVEIVKTLNTESGGGNGRGPPKNNFQFITTDDNEPNNKDNDDSTKIHVLSNKELLKKVGISDDLYMNAIKSVVKAAKNKDRHEKIIRSFKDTSL